MQIGLIFELLKVSIETFNNERKDRFLKQYVKLEKDYNDEISKPVNNRSDFALDSILFECETLVKLVIAESRKPV